MDALRRRQVEMGTRALDFGHAHPDASPGSALALADLKEQLRTAGILAAEQQDGIRAVRAATAQKRELRQLMNDSHLLHVARAGQAAAKELPELAQTFEFTRDPVPYTTFRSRAETLVAAAETHRELLTKHGLADTAFDGLKQALADFDVALAHGMAGRLTHVGASAKLAAVAGDIVKGVKIMDGLNRFRFRDQPDLLAAWKSASKVADFTRTPEGQPPAGGEVKTA
jgi:hypothetical protein